MGISSPSGKLRSTRYLGIFVLPWLAFGRSTVRAGRRPPHRANSPDWRRPLPILGGDPQTHRFGARLAPGAHSELAQNRRDVVSHRLLREEEASRDLGVRQSLGDEREDLDLPVGEPAGVRARRRTGAALHAPRAPLAEAP